MADFHFIRPWWLLATILLVMMLFVLKKHRIKQSGWQNLLPKHLAKVLVDNNAQTKTNSLLLPFIIGMLTIVSLAGPTWKKLPQPVYQVAKGSVLIMDMSYSMYATDITPNRLTRARYKAIDLLNKITDGEVGLIAYAGDAFSISPLTEDVNNIKLLLPSLTPDLMPELGSNPFAALALADEMLKNAGHNNGDIYWFTDGIDNEDIQDITQWSREHPYRLNILGIGTKTGAPIKLKNGELMKDSKGAIIVPKLSEKSLLGLAKRGRGNYVTLSHDSLDIEKLTQQSIIEATEESRESKNTGDQWQEFGPYLLLLILPLFLSYFRRGALLSVLPALLFIMPAKQSHANIWQDLWKTQDQQGQANFNQQQYQQAAEQFQDPLWQGSAHYKAGDFEQALSAFKKVDSAQSLFNQGNALAKMQKVDEAISAYEQALEKDPNLLDAKANKKILEQLKQQQEQEQNNQEKQDQNSEENQEQNQNEQQGDNSGEQEQSQQEQNEQQNGQQQEQSNAEESDQQKDNQSSEQSAEQETDSQQDNANKKENEQQSENKEQETQQPESTDATQSEGDESEQALASPTKAEKEAKETEQKHQQLLNKVTDDPYMLLRNKMQLEYQKRRQNRSSVGVKKKW